MSIRKEILGDSWEPNGRGVALRKSWWCEKVQKSNYK